MLTYVHKNLMKRDLSTLDVCGTHQAYRTCNRRAAEEKKYSEPWSKTHADSIKAVLLEILPHGSGIDADWTIDLSDDSPIIVCHNSFHRMDDNGYYVGWYDFSVVLDTSIPGLLQIKKITAKGLSSDHKDDLWDRFHYPVSEYNAVFQAKRTATYHPELLTLAVETVAAEERTKRLKELENGNTPRPVVAG